ncbi:hypothetical protein ABRP83_08450 [Pectobacterium brasiliense]|uniref:hypothetical protein n=1 Tax=Pectobacterium brasiliense TaxID=180957 RepID=UPI0032EA9F1B
MNINNFNNFEITLSSHNIKLSFSVKEEIKLYVTVVKLSDEIDAGFSGKYRIMPIEITSTSIKASSDVTLCDDVDNEIGIICLRENEVSTEFDSLTIPQYICSIVDSELNRDEDNSCLLSLSFTPGFSKSYVLLNEELELYYINNFQDTAPLWGGFSHTSAISSYSSEDKVKIKAIKGLHIPTKEHTSKLIDAINSTNGFDRFLKKYHLLELLYDYICVIKLKTLPPSIKEFRNIMLSYDKEEISSLKNLMGDYVTEIGGILDSMYKLIPFLDLAKDIFQHYSKDSNPLKDPVRWSRFIEIISASNASYDNYKSKFGNNKTADEYRKDILNIAAYWIYRMRCSIAHNKIGEFIFDSQQEIFIVEFGENLIDEITKQLFSNIQLRDLFEVAKKIDEIRNSAPA